MDEVEDLIEQLKSKDNVTRGSAAFKLGKLNDKRAVPALIEAIMDEDWYVREQAVEGVENIGKPAVPALIEALRNERSIVQEFAAGNLRWIAEKCETMEELGKIEKQLEEYLVVLKKERPDKTTLINAQMTIAKLTRIIAKKKNKLAPKKDLLLDDKPKPPKKGRGVYQVSRKIRNR